MKYIPPCLNGHILHYNWDVTKVWELEAQAESISMHRLAYLFDLPLWSSRPNAGMLFDVSPAEVLRHIDAYPHQKQRIDQANTEYPIDMVVDGYRYYVLDGLHRLAKLKLSGQSRVNVRLHSPNVRARIEVQ